MFCNLNSGNVGFCEECTSNKGCDAIGLISEEGVEEWQSRRQLEGNDDNVMCNGTLFRLDLRLDSYPEETSWELVKTHSNIVVANRSYENDIVPFFIDTFTQCIQNVPHQFTLFILGLGFNVEMMMDAMNCILMED